VKQELHGDFQDLPSVSILMVNYNGRTHLEEFFESVFKLNYPENKYEIVVMDNASTDGSPDWIEQNCPQVKLVRLDENYGFEIANNKGVKDYCKGDFIALQNSDVVLDENWLIELVRQAVKKPEAIYGSKMLWYHRRDYIVYAGGKLFFWGDHCHLQTYAQDSNEQNTPFMVLYADGCGALLSRKLYLEIGGFNESYWVYADDYELSWKAWLSGYKVYFVPTAKFYHKVSASYGMRSHTHIYFLLRNQMRNIIKFTELSTLILMFPLFILYYLGMYLAVYCFQEKKISLILPILQAFLKIASELPFLIKIRRRFQKERRVTDRDLKKLGLILTFRQSIKEALATFSRKGRFWKETAA
jgi:GT2 family glycosyltransferase